MRRLFALACALFLLLTLSPAFLSQASAANKRIVDDADLLSDYEESALAQKAQQLADTYGMDVIIHTVDTLGGKSPQAYADDYFDENGYGIGNERSGVILVFSTQYADAYISTSGNSILAISDSDIDRLFDTITHDMSLNNYYGAFTTYLSGLEICFSEYQESLAPPGFADYVLLVVIALAIGAAAGGIGLLILRSGMNTVTPQVGAQSYFVNNSFSLPVNQNVFLYTNTSRTRIPKPSSIGGGSSTHRSSSGRSHGGGGRRF